MLRSLNSAISGMSNSQDRMDVIGNNIANVNTTAFKAARMDFADAFSQTLRESAAGGANTAATAAMQVGMGVSSAAIKNLYTQGALTKTDVPTDLAIGGEGFFLVRDAVNDAVYATRSGEFRQEGGFLVNNQGMRLRGYSDPALTTIGDIQVDTTGRPPSAATVAAQAAAAANPTDTTLAAAVTAAQAADAAATVTSFSINKEGKVTVRLSDNTEFIRGQVLLQNFRDPQALQKEGNNLYSGLETAGALATPGVPSKSGLGGIVSGHLELSNVDIANEFASLITTQRAFQANARIITTSDDMIQEVVNLKR